MAKPDELVLGDGVKLADLLKIMEGMRKHNVAALEMPGLKLTLAPEMRPLVEKPTTQTVVPLNVAAANKQMDAARAAVAKHREEQRRDRLASKAGGIGMHTNTLTQQIYEDAMKTPPPAPSATLVNHETD